MRAVLQRVLDATVISDGIPTGNIGKGLYILLDVENGDTGEDALLLAEKISKLRIFSDENSKMNLSLLDIGGEVLIVSNFTLNANYSHGNRPDYLNSAPPTIAKELYLKFVDFMKERHSKVDTGVFGADMKTTMTTDGPVTIVMQSEFLRKKH